MRKTHLTSLFSALALVAALGGARTLYAAEDPIFFEDGDVPTCSSGTSNVCRTSTTSTTSCSAWQWVGMNGSAGVGGFGMGLTLVCKTEVTTSSTENFYWSK